MLIACQNPNLTILTMGGHIQHGSYADGNNDLTLQDSMKKWIKKQVKANNHGNANHYVPDPIQYHQSFLDKRAELIKALVHGENSGVANHTIENIWQDIKSRQRNTWLTKNSQAINTCNELAENYGLFADSHRSF
jgi:post-segregation antitoxin (ccd killing protein)